MKSSISRRSLLGSALAFVGAGGLACVGAPSDAKKDEKDKGPEPEAAGLNTSSLKGQPVPDFSLPTLDGKEVNLSDLKGKVVLIDFWATWCPPCIVGLPHINDLSQDQRRYDQGLVVLAVNLRETPERIRKFIDEKKYAVTVPMDTEGKAAEALLVEPVPTTLVVGRDGKVSEVFLGLPKDMTVIDVAVDKALAAGS